jgi:hypothetical protein
MFQETLSWSDDGDTTRASSVSLAKCLQVDAAVSYCGEQKSKAWYERIDLAAIMREPLDCPLNLPVDHKG